MNNKPFVAASEVLFDAQIQYEAAHRVYVEAERRLAEATGHLSNAQREFDRIVGPLRMKAPEATPWGNKDKSPMALGHP